MSNIQNLYLVAPPPKNPKGIGTPAQWAELEREINLKFPKDYKELIASYGAGTFVDFFGIKAPFYTGPRYTLYKDWISLRLNGIKNAKSYYPNDAVPLPVYPEGGGLFPCGYTDNGETMCWLMEGESSRWPIICLDDGNTKDYDRFDMPLTEFIEKWLTDQILVPALTPPDFYPLRRPAFVSEGI